MLKILPLLSLCKVAWGTLIPLLSALPFSELHNGPILGHATILNTHAERTCDPQSFERCLSIISSVTQLGVERHQSLTQAYNISCSLVFTLPLSPEALAWGLEKSHTCHPFIPDLLSFIKWTDF